MNRIAFLEHLASALLGFSGAEIVLWILSRDAFDLLGACWFAVWAGFIVMDRDQESRKQIVEIRPVIRPVE